MLAPVRLSKILLTCLAFLPFGSFVTYTGSIWKNKLPAPSGSFAIGRKTFSWTDYERKDIWVDNNNIKRRVLAYIWYPAQANGNVESAAYYPALHKLKEHFSAIKRFTIGKMKTHAAEGLPLASDKKSYPILLFSPGGDMPPFFYASLIEDLVSNGYIVVGIDHTYEGKGQVFPDGSITQPEVEKRELTPNSPHFLQEAIQLYKKRLDVRAADFSFVIDQLEQFQSQDLLFAQRLNLSQIGVFGHSLGGIAAVEAALQDDRIKGAINMDGLTHSQPMYPDANGQVMTEPFLFLSKPILPFDTKRLEKFSMTPEGDKQRIARILSTGDSLLQGVEKGAYRLTIGKATHDSFSDAPFFVPGNTTEETQLNRVVRASVLHFFNGLFARNLPNSLQQLTTQFPETTLEVFPR